MNNYHDVHAWSTQYREEALQRARTILIEGRLREDRKACPGRGPVGLALASVLSLVRGAETSD